MEAAFTLPVVFRFQPPSRIASWNVLSLMETSALTSEPADSSTLIDVKAIGIWISINVSIGTLIGLPWLFPSLLLLGTIGWAALIVRASTRNRPKAAAGESFLIGNLALGIAFHWAPTSIFATTNLSLPLSWLIFGLLIAWESIAFGLLGYAVCHLAKRKLSLLWLAVPIWVAIEFHWPQIFGWSLAHTYLQIIPVIQIAELAGTEGVSAWVMLASLVMAQIWLLRSSRGGGIGAGWMAAGRPALQMSVAVLILILGYAWGAQKDQQWQAKIAKAPTIKSAAVQVDPHFVDSVDRMRGLSDSVSESVDLYVWPETALGHYHTSLTDFRDENQTYLKAELPTTAIDPYPSNPAELLAGGRTYDDGGRDRGPYRNTAFLIDSSKWITGRYVKRSLMPIGEYVPGEKWIPALRDWAAIDSELIRGTSDAPLTLHGGQKVGVLVCYEDMVAENAAASALAGAECLVAMINGSRFEDSDTLIQHLRLAQLRAVENRRPLLRCAATGVTCLIHPDGRIAKEVPIGGDRVLVASVPLHRELTIFTRYGPWFSYLATCITALTLLILFFNKSDTESKHGAESS